MKSVRAFAFQDCLPLDRKARESYPEQLHNASIFRMAERMEIFALIQKHATGEAPAPETFGEWMTGKTANVSEIMAFCGLKEIESDVKQAYQLAKLYFHPGYTWLSMESDPESDNQWIVIEANASGSVEAILEAYSRCKAHWLPLASNAGKRYIRFSYNIVRP